MQAIKFLAATLLCVAPQSCGLGPFLPSDEDVNKMTEAQVRSQIASGYYDPRTRKLLVARMAVLQHWKDDDTDMVTQERLWIGATCDQVMLSWGAPSRMTNYVNNRGRYESWFYGSGRADSSLTVVYLENNVCTGSGSNK